MSDFFRFREDAGHHQMTIYTFIECLLCVAYIDSVTHRAFYLVD